MMVVRTILILSVLAFSMLGHSAVGDPTRYWPNGSTLNILFMDGKPEYHRAVESYASEWMRYANIKFRFFSKPKEGRTDHIRIQFEKVSNKTNSSLVGTSSLNVPQTEPSMWLPEFEESGKTEQRLKRVVLHEFGHGAMGLKHEHQNPRFPYERSINVMTKCRDVKIKKMSEALEETVDPEELSSLATEKCKKRYRPLDPDKYQFTDFDPKAIMMYGIKEGTIEGDPEFFIRKSYEISEREKIFVGKIYPFAE